MGNCSSSATMSPSPPARPLPAPMVPPTSTPLSHVASPNKMPTHGSSDGTTQHDYEMPTLPHNHSAVASERLPSQASTSSQRRSDDRDIPLPPSGSNPHSQEMPSYKFKSRGRVPPQLHKSISMDTPFPQGRAHSPSRIARTSSTTLLGQGSQPTGTQVESGLASGTGQIPADRQERRPHFPSTLQSLLSNDFRFRILVVGRPGSGKSSLIKAIFNVDMPRAPTNVSGITAEFRPRDNRRLIVHECSASGPGEFQAIQDFIMIRNHKSRTASERLHAIWICLPMSDVIHGQFDEGLKLLLGTGVPLVIVFTMFDLIVNVSSHGNEYERAKEAYMTWEGHCRTLFGHVRAEIVSTRPRFRDLIVKLVATTDEVIMGHSRDMSASPEAQRTQTRMSPVTLAWSVSQRVSGSINIQAAIEVGKSRYWRRLGSSEVFAGQTLANCVQVIRSDIVGVWNLHDRDNYLSSKAFEVGISHLVQDLSRPPIGTSSRPSQSDTQETGAAWLNERYENRNEYICLMVAYIVDLTLILCDVFDRNGGNVSPDGVQLVMSDFASSNPKTTIHAEICRFLKTAHRFEYQDRDVVLAKIIDLIRQNCDSSSAHK